MNKLLIPILLLNSILLYSDDDISYLDKIINSTDGHREVIHNAFINLSSSLDDYVSDETIDRKEYYATYVLVELGMYQIQHENIGLEGKVKIRLQLPKLKNKFRVEFESDDADNVNEFIEDKTKKNDYNLGIGYFNKFKKHTNIHSKIGIKLSTKLNPFINTKIYRSFNNINYISNSNRIGWKISQNVKLSYLDKLELTSSLLISKKLTNNYSLHHSNQYYWKSLKKKNDEFFSSLSLNDKIDYKNNLTYSLNWNIDNDDSNLKLKRYGVKGDYRHLLKDWLYTDVTLENFYKEDQNFKPRYAITFHLGMYINKGSYKSRNETIKNY